MKKSSVLSFRSRFSLFSILFNVALFFREFPGSANEGGLQNTPLVTKQAVSSSLPNLSHLPLPAPQHAQQQSQLRLAQLALEKHEWESAEELFRKISEQNPTSISSLLGLSQALISLHKREEALSVILQAIEKSNVKQKANLTQRLHTAARLFFTNKNFEVFQDGLNLMMSKKYRNAKEQFEKALEQEPGNTAILLHLGQSLILDNEAESAIKKLTEARRIDPYDAQVRLWLGKSFQIRGLKKEALIELRAAYESLKSSELAAVWLADELIAQSQASSALHLLESDAKKWPFHLWSMTTLVKLRIQNSHSDLRDMWVAQRELQLVMSRISSKGFLNTFHNESDFGLQLIKPVSDIKADAQKLMQQVQSRLAH
jgi:thioredoxin-like negative regulator of GroEL